jgi:hypothetical protein
VDKGGKWAFWSAFAVVLGLVTIPSIEWMTAAREYAGFMAGWEPAPLRATVVRSTPHDDRSEPLELTPVEFRLSAPKAKSVELVGDFNAWAPGLLKLAKGGDGVWSIVVPVPQGRRKYLYLVDGEPRVDPKSDTTDGPEGRRVSVRRAP